MQRPVVFFDLETGGLVPHMPITQLAAIAVLADWEIGPTFERKIQVDIATCDPEAREVNHYDPKVWKCEAAKEAEALQGFTGFIGPYRVVPAVGKRGKPWPNPSARRQRCGFVAG